MEMLENREQWQVDFKAGWLRHYQETGQFNWKIYTPPRNESGPPGSGVDLSQSRLMLISSAWRYLVEEQTPFDAAAVLEDYLIRVFPPDTVPEQIGFAHDHYDHNAANADQQVPLPLGNRRDMVAEGISGELAPSVVNFMRYQLIATRVVDETFPFVLEKAQAERIDAALLIPA